MSGKALRPKGDLDYVRTERKLTYSVLKCCALALPGIISFNSSTQYYTQDTCLRSPSFKGAESGLKFRPPGSFHGVSAPMQGDGWGRAGLQPGVS